MDQGTPAFVAARGCRIDSRSAFSASSLRALRPGSLVLLAGWILFQTSGCSVLSPVTSMLRAKREVYHFDHPFGAESPAFRRSLDTFGAAVVPGNQVEILNNGDEIFPAMLGAIRDARRTVNMESYIFKDDHTGHLFAAALMDAVRRGVEVRLLVDGAGGRAGSLFEPMKKAGVKAYIYHPLRLWSIYRFSHRTHRKILVIDGRLCFTGGVGIEDRWQGNARNPKEWRDVQVRATGPVAAQMQAVFAEDWTYTNGEILAGDQFYPEIAPAGAILAMAIKSSPGDSSSLAEMLYYMMIQSAEKSLYIQNAYFLPDAHIRAALIAAKKRGVDVRIMVPGKHIDVKPVRLASRLHYDDMLEAGIKFYEYADTMMHSKTAVVDGIFSLVGSINFDTRSMRINAEESLGFYDRGFAGRLQAVFENDMKHCEEVTYEKWAKRGPAQRFFELVSWMFEPLY
ncbi:MAG TPA: phospholipase D-like domain-containing protein [Dongiaceae bacterium]